MGVFSTTRPISVEEQKQKLLAEQIDRELEKQMLEQRLLLEAQEAENQKKIEAQKKEQEAKDAKEKEIQAATNKRNTEDAKKALAEATIQLPAKVRREAINHALFYIVNESLWIDDEMKKNPKMKQEAIQTMEGLLETCDTITGTLHEKNFGNSKFLSCLKDVIETTVVDATNRILAEAEELQSVKIDFHLSEEEEREMEEKMDGLGAKELSKAIKDKVLQTVKDEKEAGEIKSELFDMLEKELSEEEPTKEEGSTGSEEPSSKDEDGTVADGMVDESVEACIESVGTYVGETDFVMEEVSRKGNLLMQIADTKAKHGKLEEAAGCYEAAFSLFTEAERVRFRPQEKKIVPTMMQVLAEACATMQFEIKPVTKKAVRRTHSVPSVIENPLEVLENYCFHMARACEKNRIQTETVEEMRDRIVKESVQRGMVNHIGDTLFENLMVRNAVLLQRENPVLENGSHMLKEEIQNGAMIQTVLEYTILEAFHTMKLYSFDTRAMNKIKNP